MKFHQGRLLDHVHLRVADMERSKRFYRAVLNALGRDLTKVTDHFFSSDEFFVSGGKELTAKMHLAFQATDHDAVARFNRAGVDAGGADNGAPGERSYHPGYYSAYLLDPDGNNVEAVFHGPTNRSAASVEVTSAAPVEEN